MMDMDQTLTVEQFRKWGSQGGKKRSKKLSAKQRKEAARKAALARWSKKKPKGE
jgi:hypothetical protein